MFRPMINFSLESDIDKIKAIKPGISGNFISTPAPDILLLIESRLIRRKVFQMNLSMALEEQSDLFSFVPFRSIHVEMDGITPEPSQHMLKCFEESLPVASGGTNQTFLAQKRRHPTRQVQSLAMLAGSGNFKPLTLLSPTTSKTRMQAKSGFILKYNSLIIFKLKQFFLTAGENDRHPWHELEGKHSQLFSDCNPSNAASIVPAGPATLSRNLSSGELPKWAHPSPLWSDQIPVGSFPGLVSIVSLPLMSIELAALAEVEGSEMQRPACSLRESSSLGSCDLAQTKRLSVPDAGPPKPTIRQQLSIQSMPPELALPGLIALLGLLQAWLYLKLSCLKYTIYFVNVKLFSAFVLVWSTAEPSLS